MYASLIRVRKSTHLQVVHFDPKQPLPPAQVCVSVCDHHSQKDQHYKCCRSNLSLEEELLVSELQFEEHDDEYEDEGEGFVITFLWRQIPSSRVRLNNQFSCFMV
jgi:hypothetical protein